MLDMEGICTMLMAIYMSGDINSWIGVHFRLHWRFCHTTASALIVSSRML